MTRAPDAETNRGRCAESYAAPALGAQHFIGRREVEINLDAKACTMPRSG
jgi:hypothetical protein